MNDIVPIKKSLSLKGRIVLFIVITAILWFVSSYIIFPIYDPQTYYSSSELIMPDNSLPQSLNESNSNNPVSVPAFTPSESLESITKSNQTESISTFAPAFVPSRAAEPAVPSILSSNLEYEPTKNEATTSKSFSSLEIITIILIIIISYVFLHFITSSNLVESIFYFSDRVIRIADSFVINSIYALASSLICGSIFYFIVYLKLDVNWSYSLILAYFIYEIPFLFFDEAFQDLLDGQLPRIKSFRSMPTLGIIVSCPLVFLYLLIRQRTLSIFGWNGLKTVWAITRYNITNPIWLKSDGYKEFRIVSPPEVSKNAFYLKWQNWVRN